VKRHPALQPLSRDHHHGLVHAKRLRGARRSPLDERLATARAFLRFFEAETRAHFREEEELVFPLLDPPPDAIVQALVEHLRIHGLVALLRRDVDRGEVDGTLMADLGELLESHIRLEEREALPLVEAGADPDALAALDLPEHNDARADADVVVELGGARTGSGPLWGTATDDLNATLLAWEPGEGTPEHVNDERDVLVVVLDGWGTVTIDGAEHRVRGGHAVVIAKGRARKIVAGATGIRYLSVHLRRPGLQVRRLAG
jgi:quercetin dioxygenase-like cupin family protein